MTYSTYTGWGADPNKYKRNADSMANHKVIKYTTKYSGFV